MNTESDQALVPLPRLWDKPNGTRCLCGHLYGAHRDRVRADATEAKLRAAYTPIKTFCTRYAREVEFE